MTKKLFEKVTEPEKKHILFKVSNGIEERLNDIESRAEKSGYCFDLNQHVENELSRLIKEGEIQLKAIELSNP
ncbi:MAG: hypothetical protein RPR97_06110 [Colwellia sp.]